MRKNLLLNALALAGCLGVTCVPGAYAQPAASACSNATFQGDYGFTINGVVNLPASYGGLTSGDPVTIQGVQMIHSDGKGNLTDNESIMLNGNPLADSLGHPLGTAPGYFSQHHGTYTLNADCTGIAFLTNQVGNAPLLADGATPNFVYLAFVVDKAGKQVRMVVVPPFDSGGIPRTVYSIGEKVEAGGNPFLQFQGAPGF